MTAAEKDEVIALLEAAVHLNGEAQNAYDFQSYGNATQMREQSTAILMPLFQKHAILREQFPHQWAFMQRGDEDNSFDSEDLNRAKEIL